MNLAELLLEQTQSGDLERVKKLFVSRYKKIMHTKARQTRLNYIESLIDDILPKQDQKWLVLQMQKKLMLKGKK